MMDYYNSNNFAILSSFSKYFKTLKVQGQGQFQQSSILQYQFGCIKGYCYETELSSHLSINFCFCHFRNLPPSDFSFQSSASQILTSINQFLFTIFRLDLRNIFVS